MSCWERVSIIRRPLILVSTPSRRTLTPRSTNSMISHRWNGDGVSWPGISASTSPPSSPLSEFSTSSWTISRQSKRRLSVSSRGNWMSTAVTSAATLRATCIRACVFLTSSAVRENDPGPFSVNSLRSWEIVSNASEDKWPGSKLFNIDEDVGSAALKFPFVDCKPRGRGSSSPAMVPIQSCPWMVFLEVHGAQRWEACRWHKQC